MTDHVAHFTAQFPLRGARQCHVTNFAGWVRFRRLEGARCYACGSEDLSGGFYREGRWACGRCPGTE